MSDENGRRGDIERYDGDRSRPDSSRTSDRRPLSSRREPDAVQSAGTDSIADAVSGSLTSRDAVTVASESARATLVGVPVIDVGEFVYDHQIDDGGKQPVALFDVENTSDSPLRWQSSRTQFIGDDEYTYGPARASLDPAQLGSGCHTRQVELPPGRKARIVTLVEALPPNVEVVEVVHSLPGSRGGRERLVFSL
ncbi:hypothetical protein [Halovenus salina]|uniref:DUF4352 domain-containing protein n=1 Tax=Halovenus salina TaxID=1510225 RepID=A0ABD5VXA6_9EURY|nr:hypothetical protein [Halovenus salina]